MFPDYEPTLKTNNDTETTINGKSFLFDFTLGDFIVKDGKVQVIEGLDSLKTWIEKALRTEKFKFKIYEKTDDENEYGISINELLYNGYNLAFVGAEIQREITETLLKNIEITNVNNFIFNRDKRALTVSFTVESLYGTISEELNF